MAEPFFWTKKKIALYSQLGTYCVSLLNQWKAEYFFIHHRSVSEKKTQFYCHDLLHPWAWEHQALDPQAAVADKFTPCSCHELHGAVWASLSELQLINWLQQLARVPRAWWPLVTCGSIRISWVIIPLYPHTRAASPFLCPVPLGPLWSESGKIFSFLSHFADIRHFLWPWLPWWECRQRTSEMEVLKCPGPERERGVERDRPLKFPGLVN